MDKQKFDNYKFSINTQVKIDNEWRDVFSIDFDKRTVELQSTLTTPDTHYCEIEDIRN